MIEDKETGNNPKSLFITVKEASELLAVKESTLYQWAERGDIPSYKFGRLVRFKKTDIEVWTESRKVNAHPSSPVMNGYGGDVKKLIENVKRSVLTSSKGKAGVASVKGGG